MNQTPLSSYKLTRIAPTPSGYLHLGNLYSFILTVGIAREANAKILLRIDDLDQERSDPAFVEDIFDTLSFMQIPWDKGPENSKDFYSNHSQLSRKSIQDELLNELRNSNKIFGCTCSRSQLRRHHTESYPGHCRDHHFDPDTVHTAWRIITDDRKLHIKCIDQRTKETSLDLSMKDFIVRRKDGIASYQLASLADDLYFGVDLIVRGQDLWPSTLAQIYLADSLGHTNKYNCHFLHHTLIRDEQGNKLSKSARATSIRYLRSQGFDAAAIYNMLGKTLQIKTACPDWESIYQDWKSKPH